MSIEHGIARSAGWAIAIRLVDRLIGLVSILVLARLLFPADYGLVAMATSIVALLEALTAFGFEWAIIQRQTTERRHLDTAWTMNAMIGLVNASALLALIPVAIKFFNEPRLLEIMVMLAAGLVVSGFRNVGMVLFEQDLKFKRLFLLGFVKKLVGFTTTLGIALSYRSYWALVVGQFAIAITDLTMSYALSPYRPRFAVSAWRDIVNLSKWLYLSNLFSFCNTRGTHLIIGNQSGAAALGTYNVAYELASLPTSELLVPTFRALFPGFSRLSRDVPRLRALVVEVLSLSTLLAIPAAAGIAVLSDPIVNVLLGPKWTDAVSLISVLAIFGATAAIFSPLSAVNLAVGRADVAAKMSLLSVCVTLPVFIVLLSKFGLVAAAWGLVCTRVGVGAINLALVMRWLALSAKTILRAAWRPLAAAALMAGVVFVVADVSWNPFQPWGIKLAILLCLIALGSACYVSAVYGLWVLSSRPVGAEAHALTFFRAATGRRLNPPT